MVLGLDRMGVVASVARTSSLAVVPVTLTQGNERGWLQGRATCAVTQKGPQPT